MYKEAQQPQKSNFLKILFCILSAPRVSGADGSEGGTHAREQAAQPSFSTQGPHTRPLREALQSVKSPPNNISLN